MKDSSFAVFLVLFALGGFERRGFFLQLPADAGARAEEEVQTSLTRHTDWRVMKFKAMFSNNVKYEKKLLDFYIIS